MDGKWYRVKVNSTLDESTVAAKMVDFGDYTMIPMERLQPLWPQFRTLPMQAINASLAGMSHYSLLDNAPLGASIQKRINNVGKNIKKNLQKKSLR